MTLFDWKRLARAVKILGTVLALTAFGALVADDVHQRDTTNSLITTQRRSRPVTEFNTAYFVHLDCIKAYEVRFFGDIADAIVAQDQAGARAELAADRDELRTITTTLCPAPSPPTFDNNGTLLRGPVVHEQKFPSQGG